MPRPADPEVDELLAQADAFLSQPAALASGGGEVDALLAEADAFLAQPRRTVTSTLKPGTDSRVGLPDIPFGSPVTLPRPGEVTLDRPVFPARPLPFTDQATVVGNGPGVLETAARLPQRAAQGFVGGAIDAVATPMVGLQHFIASKNQRPADAAALVRGKALVDQDLMAAGVTVPTMATDWKNPQWWSAQVGQVGGYVAGMAATGAAAGGAGRAAAVAAMSESLTEASSVYLDLIEQGKTPDEAIERAGGTFAANMAVLGLTDLPLFKVGGTLLRRTLTKGAIEGGQEVAQQATSNIATGRPLTEGMLEGAVFGAAAGGGFASVDGTPAPARPAGPPIVPPAAQGTPRLEVGPVSPTGAGRQPGALPTAVPVAPPVVPAITPPAGSLRTSTDETPIANVRTPPVVDTRRQAIEREMGGAVTDQEIDQLLAEADAMLAATPVGQSEVPQAQAENVQPTPTPTAPSRVIQDQVPAATPPRFRREADPVIEEATSEAEPPDDRPWLERVAEDAVENGYQGDIKAARKDALARARSLYDASEGAGAEQGDDRALLERIRDSGGLDLSEKDLAGEYAWLKEFMGAGNTFAGVQGVFRRRRRLRAIEREHARAHGAKAKASAGYGADAIIEAINEDGRFNDRGIKSGGDLVTFLHEAVVAHAAGRNQRQGFDPEHYGDGAGVRLGQRWWVSNPVPRNTRLTGEDAEIHERTARAVEDDLDGHLARYAEQQTAAGKATVLSADDASELFHDYSGSKETRTTRVRAVRPASGHVINEAFRRALARPPTGWVVFTAGGNGSGKSSSIEPNGEGVEIVFDSTLSDYEASKRNIDTALANGRPVQIRYVYRDPVDAYINGVLPRRGETGRDVPIDTIVRTHPASRDTVLRLAREFENDLESVDIQIYENVGQAGPDLVPRDLAWLEEQAYDPPDVLRARLEAARPAEAAPARPEEHPGEPSDRPARDDRRLPAERQRRSGPPIVRRGEVVDTLDTGEQQPRLPGEVGDVRDQDVKPAEFEAPFSLTREVAPTKKASDGSLFMRAGTRADGGDPSPARAVYDAPPNPPKGITPPRQPVSEVQVVSELARIFGHEPKDVPSMLRGAAKRIPIPVKAGVKGVKAFGFYTIKGQVIRLRKFGDLGTFVHELGHDIDFRLFAGDRPQGDFEAELSALGTHTSPPTATKQYRVDEGVAEFFRYWFSNPAEAALQAPKFSAAFNEVLKKNTALARQFEQGRIVVQKYLAQDLETRGRARIDYSSRNVEQEGSGLLRTMETLWVDDLAAMRQAVEHLAAEKPIDLPSNAYAIARIAKGASLRASGFLEVAIRNDGGQFTGPSFRAAIAPVRHQLEDFSLYLVARRAMELKGRGIEPGMKAEEAKAILAKHGSETFDAAASAVYAFQDGVIAYAVEAGVMTAGQAHAMRKLNRHYVPFWRILTDRSASSGRGRSRDSRSPVKRIKGSGRDLVDPMQAIIRNTHALVELVEQHKAMVAFIKQATDTPGGGLFLEEIKTPQVKTQFGFSQIRDQLVEAIEGHFNRRTTEVMRKEGRDPDAEAKTFEQVLGEFNVDELLQVFTPATAATGTDRTISVMHAGQRVFYHVTDAALFEALTAIGPKATSQAMRWFYKVAGAPARTLRAGATLTFGFMARNPVRDAWVAAIQSRVGFRPGVDSLRGLFSFLKQDAYYEQFLNSGAGTAAMVSGDRNVIARELRKLKKAGTLRDHLATVAFHPIDTLRALSEAGEMMTRLGEFRLTLDKRGVTRETLERGDQLRREEREAHDRVAEEFAVPVHDRNWRLIRKLEAEWRKASDAADAAAATTRGPLMEAALNARDVTVDFARKGSLGGEVNQVAAFFNARVQGYSRLAQTFREAPGRSAFRVATSVTLFSLVLWALNKDDEEYAELPAWERDTYWHIPLARFGGTGWLRIPKPFELGALFGNVFERAMDQIIERDPHAWKRIFVDDPTMDVSEMPGTVAKDLAKNTFAAIFPTAVLPIVESMTNYSLFRQKPIVSPFDADLPPELQYNRWTSETAKVIGRGMGASPAMIDHMIMGYGAGLARGVVEGGLDKAIAVVGGPSKPPAPATPIDRMPGLGVFAKRYAGGDAESIADLYRRRDELRAAPRTVERFNAEGRADKAQAFASRFPDRDAEAKRINAAAKQLGEVRDLVSMVYGHQTLEPQEKRELLDRLDEHMVNIARRGLGRGPLPSRFPTPMPEALARRAFERRSGPPIH